MNLEDLEYVSKRCRPGAARRLSPGFSLGEAQSRPAGSDAAHQRCSQHARAHTAHTSSLFLAAFFLMAAVVGASCGSTERLLDTRFDEEVTSLPVATAKPIDTSAEPTQGTQGGDEHDSSQQGSSQQGSTQQDSTQQNQDDQNSGNNQALDTSGSDAGDESLQGQGSAYGATDNFSNSAETNQSANTNPDDGSAKDDGSLTQGDNSQADASASGENSGSTLQNLVVPSTDKHRYCTTEVGTDEELNLRETPNVDAEVLAVLKGGSCAIFGITADGQPVLSPDGRWVNVKYQPLQGPKVQGWIFRGFLEPVGALSVLDSQSLGGVALGTDWKSAKAALIEAFGQPTSTNTTFSCQETGDAPIEELVWNGLHVYGHNEDIYGDHDFNNAVLASIWIEPGSIWQAVGLPANATAEQIELRFPTSRRVQTEYDVHITTHVKTAFNDMAIPAAFIFELDAPGLNSVVNLTRARGIKIWYLPLGCEKEPQG